MMRSSRLFRNLVQQGHNAHASNEQSERLENGVLIQRRCTLDQERAPEVFRSTYAADMKGAVPSTTQHIPETPPRTPSRDERSTAALSPPPAPKNPRSNVKRALSARRAATKRRDILFEDSCLAGSPSRSRSPLPSQVCRQDAKTEFLDFEVRRWHEDHRSAITKKPTVLPRNKVLLNILQRQHEGRFIDNLIGDSRMQNRAPELRELFDTQAIRKAGLMKRVSRGCQGRAGRL